MPDDASPTPEERRFRSLVQAFSDFLWRTDADGRLVVDMPRWRAVTGQSEEELLGLGWLKGVHADDRAQVEAEWASAVAARGIFASQYRITGPGGTRHLEVRGAPVLSDAGEVLEWIGWAADVTDRAAAETARVRLEGELAGDRRALQQVVDQAPTAIAVLWGPGHRFRFYNRRYAELVPPGRPLTGLTVAEALPEAVDALPLLDRAFAGEEVVHREFPIPFDDQRSFAGRRYYDFTYSPIVDRGKPAGVLVVAVEVTEEVRLRSDLQQRLAAEREVAEQLQRAVLPERVPEVDGLELAVRYLPAAQVSGVGGDWYDVLPLPGDRLLLVIGDVAGRGLEAATAMVQLRSALRAFAVEDPAPGEVLGRLSRHCLALGIADFVTVLVAVADPGAGRLVYASAGHPPLLRIPAEGAPELAWHQAGPPIGAPVTGYEEAAVDLAPGDAIVLYTDGVVEERTRTLDASLEDLRAAADAPERELDAVCDRMLAGRRMTDDAALLACRRLPLPAPAAAPAPALDARFPAEPVTVGAVRNAVARMATDIGLDADVIGRIRLAVSEATTNAVLHAYRDDTEPGDVLVRAAVHEGELRVVVADRGAGIRPREDSPGLGLGLGLISALTTRVDFVSDGGGTEVQMTWRL